MAQVGYAESRLGLRLVEHRRNVTQSSATLGRGVELSAHATQRPIRLGGKKQNHQRCLQIEVA